MIRAWRLVKRTRAAEPLSGEGARIYGGRWNLPGTPVVYLADSLALAALEVFVHLDADQAGLGFAAFPVEIPEELVEGVDPARLPANWRQMPAPRANQALGSRWVEGGSAAVLKLPSALVPVEHNYMVNLAHPQAGGIVLGSAVRFTFDPRMWKEGAPGLRATSGRDRGCRILPPVPAAPEAP